MKFETLWIDSRETAKQEEKWLPEVEMHGHSAFHKEMLYFRSLFSLVSLSSEHLPARSCIVCRAGYQAVPDLVKPPDDTRSLVWMSVQTLTGQENVVGKEGKKPGKGTPISVPAPNPSSRRGARQYCTAPCASFRDTQKDHSGP